MGDAVSKVLLSAREQEARITSQGQKHVPNVEMIMGAILSLHVNVNVPDFFKEGGGYT